jgi:16S rRNA G966 N2-methylase RsmD
MLDANPDEIDRALLRRHLGTKRFIPTSAKASVYKALFDMYKPDSVLDLSSGWGERLLGFEASDTGTRYVGLDPDVRVIEAAKTMVRMCRQTRKKVELYPQPSEDFVYSVLEDKVDMLVFSPPPYNNVRYTDSDTQAYIRYATPEAFMRDFLFETIRSAWDALRDGGTLVLDFADIKAPKRDAHGHLTGGRYRMTDELLKMIEQHLPGAQFRGSIGVQRTSHKKRKFESVYDKTRVDPMWILTKSYCRKAKQCLFGSKVVDTLEDFQRHYVDTMVKAKHQASCATDIGKDVDRITQCAFHVAPGDYEERAAELSHFMPKRLRTARNALHRPDEAESNPSVHAKPHRRSRRQD